MPTTNRGWQPRQAPDSLPPVEWLTYGSGYLAGMKLGDTPLVEYTRDRLHRETVRSFGGWQAVMPHTNRPARTPPQASYRAST